MLETRTVKFELREMSEEGIFQGYASVFNEKVPDFDEIVLPGAFKQTLNHHGGRVAILDNHDTRNEIGTGIEATEDKNGLLVTGQLAINVDGVAVQKAKERWALMKLAKKHGRRTGLSIGFRSIKDEVKQGTRYLQEIALMEYSLTSFPAAPNALVTEMRTVVAYQDFPLADVERPWKAAAAEKRWRAKCGGDDNLNWQKYHTGFLWYDAKNPESITSHKLLIVDVIDGSVKAVPRAIFAAAAAVQGARGGVNIPEADKARVRKHLEKYYKRLDREPPWNQKSLDFLIGRGLSNIVYSVEDDDLALLLRDEGVAATLQTLPEDADVRDAQYLQSYASALDKVLAQLRG